MLTIAWCQAVLVKNLLEHLIYKRGIGHTGIYKKLCFRLRSPNRHSRGCEKEQLYTSPETPVTGMGGDVLWAILVFARVCCTVSIRKSACPHGHSYLGILGHHQSLLSTTWEAPICLLLFSSLPVTLSLGILCCSQVSGFQSCILLLLPHCSLLLNTLKETSTTYEGFIPNAPFNFCDLLLISGVLGLIKVMFTILIFSGASGPVSVWFLFLETLMNHHWVLVYLLNFI